MLKYLNIQNLILVEQAAIPFSLGLNILTGETGSGKSAIMHGLSLAIGERADTSLIRRGCDKGVVEAIFEIDHSFIPSLLDEGGIEHEVGQDLIIRREIAQSGKGRIFINNQMAQLSFLRKLGLSLIQMISQHANQSLFSLDYHREVIDLYGDLHVLLHHFQQSYDAEKTLRIELEGLIQQEAQRLRDIDAYQRELEELEEAQIKEGEDEELFAEYTVLSHIEEISTKVNEINQVLLGERQSLLAMLNRQKQTLESLVRFDSSLQDTAQSFQNAFLELQEIAHTLRHYQSRLNFNADRLQEIDRRLSLLNRLKRKYGATTEEILNYQAQTRAKLKRLENADDDIERLQRQLQEVEAQTNQLADDLTLKRQHYAAEFALALTKHLHSLNMPKAEFSVQLTKHKRTREGDDRIEFFLCPNIGEHQVPLKEGASGGEISRVLLAVQALLAGKEKTATLIFDEVDANIGGETATIVGDKLREISQQHQVICITHFPQVASQADHHLQISKKEREGRTITIVQELDAFSRQRELARMSGLKRSTTQIKRKNSKYPGSSPGASLSQSQYNSL
jgi:DNA repair protein RecN (Recombination protein N)